MSQITPDLRPARFRPGNILCCPPDGRLGRLQPALRDAVYLAVPVLMIIIRSEQLPAFETAARDAFEDRIVRQMAFEDEDEARTLVRLAVRKCLGYGIDVKADIEEFLGLMVRYSPDFETGMPWAMAVLESNDLSGNVKMRILLRKLGGR